MDGFFPSGLQLGKQFFSNVTTIAPALAKLAQGAGRFFPVWGGRLGGCPGFDFINQGLATGFVF